MTGFVQIQEEILGKCDQMYTLASAQHCALENFIDRLYFSIHIQPPLEAFILIFWWFEFLLITENAYADFKHYKLNLISTDSSTLYLRFDS